MTTEHHGAQADGATHASTSQASIDPQLAAELRSVAKRLARGAGTIAFHGRRNAGANVDQRSLDTKSSATDLVTAFDRAAEAEIVDWLRRHRPDDGIVGEEGTAVAGTNGLEWHIDPIDGTTNFVYDQPAWSCSVGVRSSVGTLAGAVYVPALDEMFSAARGQGATLNDLPITVSGLAELELALVATGFSFLPQRRSTQAALVAELISSVRDIRRLGSASVDLCFVACGRLDAYFETGLNSWDMLAGELIAVEAGAASSNFAGQPVEPGELLVSAPGIHRALIDQLRSS